MTQQNLDRDRFRGALLGLAVGDAVGTAVEFKPPGTFKPVSDMTGGGPFGLPAGAWTDDTSMALCLAESLVECGGFDPIDQLQRYVRWYREGHWSSTGRCFDIGNATRSALHRFERTGEPYPGDADPDAAGNGPLMKLAPVPMAFALHPDAAVEFAGESARTTHGALEAVDAARYFSALLVGALQGATVGELLHQGVFTPGSVNWTQDPLHPKVLAVASGSFNTKEPPAVRGGGYIIDALEAALWALRSTRTFEEGVLAAVNLGDDADTTAAIYGQLAGALFGVDAIPKPWRDQVVMREEILTLADTLYDLAHSVDGTPPPAADVALVPTPPDSQPASTPGDSYWVVPGKILAGPYPGAPSKSAARGKLEAFVDLGVTCFLDLTEEGEGPPLHPYAMLLRRVASSRKRRITYLRMPIRDVDIPTSWQMRAILATLRAALEEGETVYIHCWGGVGRTGTVVGCYLREEGASPSEVLGMLAAMRTQTERAHRTSPETEAQRTLVTQWESSGALILDQQALDQLEIEPVVIDARPVPSLGEVASALGAGSPVVIEGPGPGWCVQGVGTEAGGVHVEVLDPEHWDSGPALPTSQVELLHNHGLEHDGAAWSIDIDNDDDRPAAHAAAELMLRIAREAWGVESEGSLRPEDIPSDEAEWQQIVEFAHTFDGYAHFGESWGERFNAVRQQYQATGALPDDIDDLRACLFLEFRSDRFTWGDDVVLSEPDAEGVRTFLPNPDFESTPTYSYRRAIISRLRQLVELRP